MTPIPVILDTDIGGDIDDTWALAFLLRCPELDVRLITSATGNTTFRARLIAKLLEAGGRCDIPIGIGIHQSDGAANQGSWIADYDLSDYPGRVHRDGVEAIVTEIRDSPVPITVISIAPGTNLAEALRREPKIAKHCRYVGMNGSLAQGVEGKIGAVPECNVVSDLAASQSIFTASWDMTIAPLDSCGVVKLMGENYRRIEHSADPLARAVIENYDAWWSGHPIGRTTVLFDTVAVYLAFSDTKLEMETMGIRISPDGYTRQDDFAKPMRVAVGWKDLAGFETLLVERLTGSDSLRPSPLDYPF